MKGHNMKDKVTEIEILIKEIMKNNGVENWQGFNNDELISLASIIHNNNIVTSNNFQVKSIKVSSKEQLEKILEVLEDISDEKKEFLA